MNADVKKIIEEHEEQNKRIMKQCADEHIDIDSVRFIEHQFLMKEHRDAVSLAKELYGLGYLVLSIAPMQMEDGSEVWNVGGGMDRSLKEAASNKLSTELVMLAAKFNARYDSFGTDIGAHA